MEVKEGRRLIFGRIILWYQYEPGLKYTEYLKTHSYTIVTYCIAGIFGEVFLMVNV